MVLGYQARLSTQDVDVLILPPPPAHEVRALAKLVAQKRAWPAEWLNDAAKGYLVGLSDGPTLIAAPGIEVRQPTAEQLLAMKLCAWRDDVDINDAARLLQELRQEGDAAAVWRRVSPYLLRGRELKAQYAFTDLWGSLDEPA
jgi:predicted nucleotidyltransferase